MKIKRIYYTRDGWLTSYGLACGYVELAIDKNADPANAWSTARRVTMHAEHGTIHIRAFRDGKRITWKTAARIEDARAVFRRLTREAGPNTYRVRPT